MRSVDATRFHPNTGDDLLEAETILQDVIQRRRRVFGPAHARIQRHLAATYAKPFLYYSIPSNRHDKLSARGTRERYKLKKSWMPRVI